jgi:protein ImuB
VRLVGLNREAEAAGLSVGMTLAGARALVPDLVVADDDPEAQGADLMALARWCMRWSPYVGVSQTHHTLFIDATGSTHLFGGEQAMLADTLARVRRLGFSARAACAATPGAAFGLACFASEAAKGLSVEAMGKPLRDIIDTLPVEALRIAPNVSASLRALGLKTVGSLARLSSAAIARRFGPELLRSLDRTRGLEDEAIDPVNEIAPRRVRLRLIEPLMTADGMEKAAARAAGEMCLLLDRYNEGARRLAVHFYRVDGAVLTLEAGAGRAHRDAVLWNKVLRERMGVEGVKLDPGFGIDLIEASAAVVEVLEPIAIDLDPVAAAALVSADALHRLADRLSARLGPSCVSRFEAIATWVPEKAVQRVQFAQGTPKATFPSQIAARRPALLLDHPEPVEAIAEVPDGPPRVFFWRKLSFKVANAEGPERITCAPDRDRDYYRIETDEGRRFWLYRDGLPGKVETPRWYVHGSAA